MYNLKNSCIRNKHYLYEMAREAPQYQLRKKTKQNQYQTKLLLIYARVLNKFIISLILIKIEKLSCLYVRLSVCDNSKHPLTEVVETSG